MNFALSEYSLKANLFNYSEYIHLKYRGPILRVTSPALGSDSSSDDLKHAAPQLSALQTMEMPLDGANTDDS